MEDKPPIDAAMLEKFRQTGLRLDRNGQFWHEGAIVSHRGIRAALLRWLDTLDDGRSVFRLDPKRYAYVDVEDAHLLATSALWQGNHLWLVLNDGSQEELDYGTLVVDDNDAMYCRVRGNRLRARLTPDASATVAERVSQEGKDFVLHAAGRTFRVASVNG